MASKFSRLLRSYFTGTIFQQEEVKKHYKLFFVIFCWIIIMIYVSGSADYKIYNIKKLDDKRRELKSEHVNYRAKLMEKTKPSIVTEEVKKLGLENSYEPPIVISK